MSAFAYRRYPFTNQRGIVIPKPDSFFGGLPWDRPPVGDTADDVAKIWGIDNSVAGRVTIDPVPEEIGATRDKMTIFDWPVIPDLGPDGEVTKIEAVIKIKPVRWGDDTSTTWHYVEFSLINNSASDYLWEGLTDEPYPTKDFATIPLWNVNDNRHGVVFDDTGVNPDREAFVGGSQAVDEGAFGEYRIDLTGKDLTFLSTLQGCLFVGHRSKTAHAVAHPMVIDIYGVFIELTLRGGSSASATLSSAG